MKKDKNIPLLYEISQPGKSGVDLPPVNVFATRTGSKTRSNIDLPSASEPQVMRHFAKLSQLNYSIDTQMYPLGSCTMKHNPRLNEKLARLSGFANIHPLQPQHTVQGALGLMHTLEHWLSTLTGLPGITLAPAAGAQGELAGMMMIRKAIQARGEKRSIVLVPDSAHGTNPATAVTCGFSCKEIKSGPDGMVDMQAFAAAIKQYGTEIAAFMLTNPNTCGLFERNAKKIADELHKIGAFFYCDGANFNAIAGKIRPADVGVDVMQFNLHKTFSTPHGGGGPGCGPVAVAKELVPFLPLPRVGRSADNTYQLITHAETSIGRIRSFNGQFGMMVRALAYILSHGGDGLKKTAETAVLNANYIFHQLKHAYYAPFPGPCMHECLLTDRLQRKNYNVTTLDIAKGLIERDMHPMTVYFPLVVQGAMLIEPTESESKATLDSFIRAMLDIAAQAEHNSASLQAAPQNTPRKRLDEVRAARYPRLTWFMPPQNGEAPAKQTA